uniref:C-type lectin domain family 4 member K-like n=1 Tax=Styela clava TaxID=7725 RepID=UPI00193950B7|nr:C-type lectin domain family 4 member K-like [Styela clava]
MEEEDSNIYEYANGTSSCGGLPRPEREENTYVIPIPSPHPPPTLSSDVYESMIGQYRPSDSSIQTSTTRNFEKYNDLNKKMKRIIVYFVFIIFLFAAFTIVGFALLQMKHDCLSRDLEQTSHALNDSVKIQKQLLRVTGWYLATNHRIYKLYKTNMTYFAAEKICQSENSLLVTSGIRDPVIRSELIKKVVQPGGYDTWIGVNDIKNEGHWVWLDNVTSNLNDTYWMEGRPNNYNGNENCGHLWKTHNYKVNDANCKEFMYFICEA